MTAKRQNIVDIGAEGGSITVYRIRDGQSWLYGSIVKDWTLELLGGESIQRNSPASHSLDDALKEIDRYAWHRFQPTHVHPKFCQRIWIAVQRGFAAAGDDETDKLAFEEWRRACRATHGQPDSR